MSVGATDLGDRVRELYTVDEEPVLAVPGADLAAGTSQDRYRLWRKSIDRDRRNAIEYLLPRVERAIVRRPPAFMEGPRGHQALSDDELRVLVDELGPWRVPFELRDEVRTIDEPMRASIGRDRIRFRRELIIGTLVELLGAELGETSVLDIGCNCGFFSLEAAAAGAADVHGFDLRAENIAQARFLAEHHAVENVTFVVADEATLHDDRTWDVVLNLGVLYHVTEPLRFLRQTYERCRRFAIIDTLCTLEPFAGFVLLGDKDVSRPTEGSADVEMHPTYRGAIDTIRYAGFSEIVEIVGVADPPHSLYAEGRRRCFVAIK